MKKAGFVMSEEQEERYDKGYKDGYDEGKEAE